MSLLPSIIFLSFHTLKGWALVFFHSFLREFISVGIFHFSFKQGFLYLQKNLPSFSALSFHTLWENANGPSVIPLWVYLFRCLFYHYPSFLNHSIQSILLGGHFMSSFPFSSFRPCPSILFRRPVLGYFCETFQSAIIPYFEKGRLCLFSLQISCLLALIYL